MIGVGPAGPTGLAADARSQGRATERDAWIALSVMAGIGPVGFARLIARHGSATAAWNAGPDAVRDVTPRGPGGTDFEEMWRRDPRQVARTLERATERAGGRVVTGLDEEYPPALRTLDPRPPTLFIVGPSTVFEERAVAIVGTRRASGYGLTTATEIADDLARAGVVVVSGLALGIDGAAHRASVAAGAPSIAVLPSPIDRIYPPRHRPLARDLLRNGGALVSEIATGASVGRPDFARRNRIIAGLSEAVVVVEAPDRSGALLTAAAANSIGRELYAVPGPIDAMASRGCNRLIADQQATLVTSSVSLLRQIGLARGERPPTLTSLSEVEGQILRHLLERSVSIEELV
ncbi:MAG: DNA-processing protein DprA, partial [Candidatus Limnocylindria bacterium]